MRLQTPFDDVAFEASERTEEEWRKLMVQESTLMAIGRFIVKHRGGGTPTLLSILKAGSFNAQFRMEFQDGGSAVIRFPKAGTTMFPEEKIQNEVATMKLIQEKTTIPVPFILHWGSREESPLQLGPFIIMEYVKHHTDMGQALNIPGRSLQDPPYLDPNINPAKLEKLYRQVADILLQLSRLQFPAIGAFEETDDCTWEVTQRPLSMFMNELIRLGSFPRAKLPESTFQASPDYFERLAQLHLDHLTYQRNDAVESEEDGKRKFIARHLFYNLAREKTLSSAMHSSGPFRLWCDDLRPSNILLDEDLQIVAVVDLEFSYAAPVEFSFAPPWWLILEQPEYWPYGLDDWEKIFQRRLPTFLKAMAASEDAAIASGMLCEDQRLSQHMRESWDNGDFWVMYAARKNFAFDDIFWRRLYPRFFGPGVPEDAWKERLEMLDVGDLEKMETLVARKMKERETRELVWEPDEPPGQRA
ncbi:Protein kinase-like domain [Cordyceps militaris CM01]|uniref:Protein kinase-like domain n=1 Tax=Cordyceps militaris (strain CM01) TaxID=983644 RepID=G3JAN3_CORMM|nr:Protein kinase-like domain [Cordyceps militaris CM01]EGX95148.1 Protein kinase-like domain [Cordyceps militaris CM01]